MRNLMQKIYNRMDHSSLLQCIRSGLVMMIPILMIGSLALLLRSLPIPAWQDIITTFLSGTIYQLLTFIYNATFGLLAVYMTISISISYIRQNMSAYASSYGPLFSSIVCFCIFSGFLSDSFTLSSLGVNGTFTAIVCALSASSLYCKIRQRMPKFARFYADGADGEFNSSVMTVFPCALVIFLFALLNLVSVQFFHVNSFQVLFINLVNGIFSHMGRSLGSALLFELSLNLLWFFGIHGSDVLEPVSQHLFLPAMDINMQLVQSGQAATEIYSKTFFDVFVVMGGCGTTICLLLAILLFSRRRSNRKLAAFSSLPMIFNINEMLVFGLPVVFNPVLFIPFILVPLVTVLTSSFAIYMGLVPVPVTSVEWTTPLFLGGYLATGSISGMLLQLVNMIIGILIYRPFIRIFDEETQQNAQYKMEQLTQRFQKHEEEGRILPLLSTQDSLSHVSKTLAEDINFRLSGQMPLLYYQPQYDHVGRCIGAEGLLRWKHPLYGTIYPPIVIQLAEETGKLMELQKDIFRSVLKDMGQLLAVLGPSAKISVNVTGHIIQTDEFEQFLARLKEEEPEGCRHMCIEITEQTALMINENQVNRLCRIHDMGYSMAIDDFSMGSTSIKYLRTNVFDLIKLDGSLSRDVVGNLRSRDIVSSITGLSESLGIHVLAEYVETKEQQKLLEEMGCLLYQGYWYSPAVPLECLEDTLREIRERIEA